VGGEAEGMLFIGQPIAFGLGHSARFYLYQLTRKLILRKFYLNLRYLHSPPFSAAPINPFWAAISF